MTITYIYCLITCVLSPFFFCQPTAYPRVRVLQGKDNTCEITTIQQNKSKLMCLRKCELCHWKSAIGFLNAIHATFSLSFEPYLSHDMEEVTAETFLHRCQSQIPYLFWGNPALQLKNQLRLQCSKSWGLCHLFLSCQMRR